MGEVAKWSADLPQAVVCPSPVVFDVGHDRPLQRPREPAFLAADLARLLQGDHGGTENVSLILGERTVSLTHRCGAAITGKALDSRFGELSFTAEPVHDLDVSGVPGNG